MHVDERSVVGCLIGTAVGDALGLAREGLSPRRQRRLFPDADRYGLLGSYGLTSDDTEHACMTGQALLASGGEPERFARSLGWRLRWWLAALPAGIGMATLRACLKLWLGFSSARSGVRSAGNGPAMRAPLLGVLFGSEPQRLSQLVRASTVLTHRDAVAEAASHVVALAAWHSARGAKSDGRAFAALVEERLTGTPEAATTCAMVLDVVRSIESHESAQAFVERLGCARGVTGYVMHTVPAVLHVWLRYGDSYRDAVKEIISLGGDSDTTGAILGGIVGARVGRDGVPEQWRTKLAEWPRTVGWMEELGSALARAFNTPQTPVRPLSLNVPGLVLRNLFMMLVVLTHGFRRVLPPY